MRTILSLRIDYYPSELCKIIEYFSQFDKVLVYQETQTKLHLHIRYESCKTRQYLVGTKMFKTLNIQPRNRHAHHTIMETGKDGSEKWCTKHKDCKMGSFTYIAKNCKLLLNKGYDDDFISHIQKIGKQILAQSKKPRHVKIIDLYNLNCNSTPEDCANAIMDFFTEHNIIPPMEQHLPNLVHKIRWTLDHQTPWAKYGSYKKNYRAQAKHLFRIQFT